MINPVKLMELKSKLNQFKTNHPKFPAFLRAVSKNAMKEGTVIAFSVQTPEGEVLESNLKLQDSDLEFLRTILELS